MRKKQKKNQFDLLSPVKREKSVDIPLTGSSLEDASPRGGAEARGGGSLD